MESSRSTQDQDDQTRIYVGNVNAAVSSSDSSFTSMLEVNQALINVLLWSLGILVVVALIVFIYKKCDEHNLITSATTPIVTRKTQISKMKAEVNMRKMAIERKMKMNDYKIDEENQPQTTPSRKRLFSQIKS